MQYLLYLSNCIFTGLKFIVPIIFILNLINIKIKFPEIKTLIRAINTLLLVGGIIFLTSIILNVWMIWSSGNDDDWQFMVSSVYSKQWYLYMLPVVSFGFLPQLMWVKKVRRSLDWTFSIVIFWLLSNIAIDYFLNHSIKIFSNNDYIEKGFVFIFMLSSIYLIIKINSVKKSTN